MGLRLPHRFVSEAVAFEICPAPGFDWELRADYRSITADYSVSPVAGHIHCVVTPAPELRREDGREISWEWQGQAAHIQATGVRANLQALGPGHYAATARVAPGPVACSSLCTALAAAVLGRGGGLVLHGAGVELDGNAVLFVGPSRAGKTTASSLTRGGRWFAADRVAVYPTPSGWYAYGMAAGSDAPDLPRLVPRPLPLGAILRVCKGNETMVNRASRAAEVGLLRAAMLCPKTVTSFEQELLEAAAMLSSATFVGVVSTVLGEDLTPVLRDTLAEGICGR